MRSCLGVLALACLCLVAGCAQEAIAHQQLEKDANEIVMRLLDKGIDATKVKDEESRDLKFNIIVPRDTMHEALKILSDYGLPRIVNADSAEIVKNGGGLIPTGQQELMKRIVAAQGDIANSIKSIPRVVDVKVVVSIPEENPLAEMDEAKKRPKVSVIVTYQPDGQGNPPLGVEDVQRFAQAAVPELKPQEVFVLLVSNRNLGAAALELAPGIALTIPPDACSKDAVIGLDICSGSRKKLINLLVAAGLTAGLLAGMAVLAVLRALRYRKDITRLTAQFAQVKK